MAKRENSCGADMWYLCGLVQLDTLQRARYCCAGRTPISCQTGIFWRAALATSELHVENGLRLNSISDRKRMESQYGFRQRCGIVVIVVVDPRFAIEIVDAAPLVFLCYLMNCKPRTDK
jgi:hypothetical protein